MESVFTFGATTIDRYKQSNVTVSPVTSYSQDEDLPNSGWDSVTSSSYWDSTGIVSATTLPCISATKGQPCASATSTITHDALGRPLVTTDGGGGTITNGYSPSGNVIDILTTLGPAPVGEVAKQVWREYNGLGQLLSECFVSTTQGSSCGQASGASGFKNSYNYNTDGTLASVVRGSQTHSFTYDVAGRLLNETYPESGTKQFFYDSAPNTPGVSCSTISGLSGVTNATPLGHLLKTYDANGTTTCFSYDANGRNIAIAYAGNNFDGNNKYFVYDAATVNSVSMVNTNGRLAEQYTAPTVGGTKVTDEGFSNSVRGELSDVYQWSTHSGGWYHTWATYFASGAVNTLTGVPGNTPWTYGLDSAGRTKTATINTTNQVTNATYNAAIQPLVITLGAGDTDTYGYDSNTGRMQSYDFAIGSTPKHFTGTPLWNQNGTLRGLTVVDGINSGTDSEVCDFGNSSNAGYDEFGRLIRVNCMNGGTAVWGQNFSYDQYENLKKTVPTGQTGTAWSPTYSSTNNTYTSATYDSNGNLLTDTFHTYTWNQDNHPKSIDGTVTMTYDAAGRMVESHSGANYYQELFTPMGEVALMNGQTVVDYRMPLPGGSTASGSSGNQNFEHRDWLGNVPFVSTRNGRSSKAARLFAPYSESYNNVGLTGLLVFTGDRQDSVAGLYDTPNRELNPSGRWVSPDPARSSWNAYAYSANPMGEIDPSGLDPKSCEPNHEDCRSQTGGDGTLEGVWGGLDRWFGFGFPGYSYGFGNSYGIGALALISIALTGVEVEDPDTNHQSAGIVCAGAGDCILWEGQPMMTVYPNIGLLSLLGSGPLGPTPTSNHTSPANNPTFTKRYLPPNAQKCSAILQFNAPPGFDLNQVAAAGQTGGYSPSAALNAVGQYGTFDFQRSRDSAGNTTFYSGYTAASNVAVGAYLYGAGFSRDEAGLISNTYALAKSSNTGDPNQATFRTLGYDMAAAGWNPSCEIP